MKLMRKNMNIGLASQMKKEGNVTNDATHNLHFLNKMKKKLSPNTHAHQSLNRFTYNYK